MEEDGDCVFNGHRFVPITGKEDIPAILAASDPAYQQFRRLWETLRKTMDKLSSKDGQPVEDRGFRFKNVRSPE